MTAQVFDNIGSPDNLEGFEELDEEDQERVREAFKQGGVPEEAEAKNKVNSWPWGLDRCRCK